MKIKNTEFKIIQGDITELDAEAIVNASNNKAKHIIHAATMGMDLHTDELKVRSSCASAL